MHAALVFPIVGLRLIRCAILLVALGLVQSVQALQLSGTLDRFERDGIRLEAVSWDLRQHPSGWAVRLHVESAEIGLAEPATKVAVICPVATIVGSIVECGAGHVKAGLPVWPYQLDAEITAFRYNMAIQDARISSQLPLAGAPMPFTLSWKDGVVEWGASVSQRALGDWPEIQQFAADNALTISDGYLGAEVVGRLEPNAPLTASGDFSMVGLSFDSQSGALAGADVVLAGQLGLDFQGDSVRIRSDGAKLDQGELLLGPLYLSLADNPAIDLSWEIDWDRGQQIAIDAFYVSDHDALTLAGKGLANWVDGFRVPSLQLDAVSLTFPAANERYLASVFEGMGWGEYALSGRVDGSVGLHEGELIELDAELESFDIAASESRVRISELAGSLIYRLQSHDAMTRLRWSEASYYDLAFGPSELQLLARNRGFELTEPVSLPLFDGAIDIERLDLEGIGRSDAGFGFRGEIQPISLRLITAALGWPILQGTLSGAIPDVILDGDVFSLAGAVSLDVFDGQVTLDQVSLERLFGVLPTLAADVTVDNIDLEQMTGAFSFGKIEGRLDGRVDGLRLLDWKPVAFDLDFHTPAGDRSRHRMSQRAVDNLSTIAGGSAASLQTTFLRFFEDFSYRDLGLKCRLSNHVCQMSGVGPGPNGGYYIVRGKGLPRLNIVGFSDYVDWPRVLAQLQQVIENPESVQIGDGG